ncbi:MAG: C25 family cysteine peptidase, partial [candidate division WOR-3 bacterium]
MIITVDSFKTAFQELADWKTKKGIPAKVVTIDSIYNEYTGADNAEKVRNFIKDVNSSWGTIWILLG